MTYDEYLARTSNLPSIDILETMATFSCTLACKSCTNYSDYNMRGGYVRWSTMQAWLDQLFPRLRVISFHIIGGEPFLNPELALWVRSFRQRYPHVMLKIVTNGTLLHKNWWIIDAMRELGMMSLDVSMHQPNASYIEAAKTKLLESFSWQLQPNGSYHDPDKILNLSFDLTRSFIKTYRGSYGNMKPYDSDPRESIKICCQAYCPLLVDGQLYKCSSLGLLHRVLNDHGQLDDPDWQPFLNRGLPLDCSDDELAAWAANYTLPHDVCRMCPSARNNPFHDHLRTVRSKMKD